MDFFVLSEKNEMKLIGNVPPDPPVAGRLEKQMQIWTNSEDWSLGLSRPPGICPAIFRICPTPQGGENHP